MTRGCLAACGHASRIRAALRRSRRSRVCGPLAAALRLVAALLPAAASAQAPDGGQWRRVVGGHDGIEVRDVDGAPVDHPFLGGLNLPRPQLADADGDGDLDLFLQEKADRVMFFRSEGGGYRWVTDSYEDLKVGEWFRFVDVDLDGDLDLLAEEPYSHVRYYRNDGAAGPPRYVLAADTLRDVAGDPIFSDRQNIPNAADIDCDGRLDLLIGRLTGTITRYEADGTDDRGVPRFRHVTDFFEDIEIVGAFQGMRHGANTMALGDIDRDGDHDLLWGDFFEAGLLLIENTSGDCRQPILRGTPVPFPPGDPVSTSGYNAPALGDLDGDGDPDLVMGVLGGAFLPSRTSVENLHYFEQGAAGEFEQVTTRLVRTLDVGSESIPAFVDLEGDGDLDLLVGNKIEPDDSERGALYLFENVGAASRPSFRARGRVEGIARAYNLAPAFGDLDGDGDPDMLLGRWRDRVAYYRNDGPSAKGGAVRRWTLADSAAITLTRGRNTTPALGDLDGDGDLDLLVGESSGALNYYRNDGGGGGPAFELVSDEFGGIDVGRRSAPFLVDLDDDDDLDLAVGSELSGLRLFRNEGSGREPSFVEAAPFAIDLPTYVAPALVDLNGDCDFDLIAGGGGGGIVLLLGTPSGQPARQSDRPNFGTCHEPR